MKLNHFHLLQFFIDLNSETFLNNLLRSYNSESDYVHTEFRVS